MTVSEAKQTQRKAGRAARKALGPEERKAANAALCAFLWQLAAVQNAQTILLYAAFGSEADLSALAEKAQAQGKTLAYPVCGEAYSLTAAVPGPDGWEMGQYGIRTPILSRSEILLPEDTGRNSPCPCRPGSSLHQKPCRVQGPDPVLPGRHGQGLLRPVSSPLQKRGEDRHCI